MNLQLIKPELNMEGAYRCFAQEWANHNEEIIPYSARLLGLSYPAWLEKTLRYEHRETCPAAWVPAHTFFLIETEKILGAINIRHELNDYLLRYGGHIGYGIVPSERGKGLAAQMLAMALPIVKNLGISKVLITCDKTNPASAKTILKNGGILENEVQEKEDEITQRYWISL